MAKKEYLTPLIRVNVCCHENILTLSGDVVQKTLDDGGLYVAGRFDSGWLED